MLQEQLRKVGVVLDITALDPASIIKGIFSGTYNAVYFGTEHRDPIRPTTSISGTAPAGSTCGTSVRRRPRPSGRAGSTT